MDFVNLHGQPVGVAPPGGKARPAARKRETAAEYHKGWIVVGFHQDHLDAARRVHVDPNGKAFDPALYMRKAKPKRAIKQVYTIQDSAQQAAVLLRKQAGWVYVDVQPLQKVSKR
jgi:hypothetical protein